MLGDRQIQKLRGLIGLCKKANYLIVGADNLKGFSKKLYLIIKSDDGGKNLVKVAMQAQENTNCGLETISGSDLFNITTIENCKIVGIKNKGLADEILKYIRGEGFVR